MTHKKSIATQLFRGIFGLYLIVTLIVTAVQMYYEYEHVNNSVEDEVSRLPITYVASLGDAMWTYNERAIRSILIGMNEVAVVTGVIITDGAKVRAYGEVVDTDGSYALYDEEGVKSATQKQTYFEKLISHKFPITYLKNNGETVNLGEGVIYTNNKIVFERVKFGFFLTIINSIVKTTALFAIFLFFIQRVLSRPLLQLASQTSLVSMDNLNDMKINVKTRGRNELKIVEESFNGMISKLLLARNELDTINQSLEDKVRARTAELENEAHTRMLAQQQAEEANAIKTDFIANVSHEIRTPMSSIYGMARFIQSTQLDKDRKGYVDIIVKNCEHLMEIINQILDFSKIESGNLELDCSSINLTEFLSNVVKLFEHQASENNIEINFSIQDDVPDEIWTDKNRLRQVITNLVNNAMKFTTAGSIAIAVKTCAGSQEKLEFSVADTGIGIPKERQSKVFDSFIQADSSISRKYGGTGLGLSICKHFVEMFGGEIWLTSREGKGTTFYFTIPSGIGELTKDIAVSH